MRIYKYWAMEKTKLTIGREKKEIRCYGGSNVSKDDALVKAREKIEKVKSKIAGDPCAFDDYEVEIREEILHAIDEKAIITRNRYGAQVLNAQELMILDIDKPKFSFRYLFRKRNDVEDKKRIVEMVRKLSRKPIYEGCGFRIYETGKGVRVCVLGKTFDPKATATRRMMKEFNCDTLYARMCRKQDCFRARLTPKPGRMKLRAYKVRFPRDSEEEQEFRKWLTEYESASRKFSVCKFIEQIGSGAITEAVRLHDEITGANRRQKLA